MLKTAYKENVTVLPGVFRISLLPLQNSTYSRVISISSILNAQDSIFPYKAFLCVTGR